MNRGLDQNFYSRREPFGVEGAKGGGGLGKTPQLCKKKCEKMATMNGEMKDKRGERERSVSLPNVY